MKTKKEMISEVMNVVNANGGEVVIKTNTHLYMLRNDNGRVRLCYMYGSDGYLIDRYKKSVLEKVYEDVRSKDGENINLKSVRYDMMHDGIIEVLKANKNKDVTYRDVCYIPYVDSIDDICQNFFEVWNEMLDNGEIIVTGQRYCGEYSCPTYRLAA